MAFPALGSMKRSPPSGTMMEISLEVLSGCLASPHLNLATCLCGSIPFLLAEALSRLSGDAAIPPAALTSHASTVSRACHKLREELALVHAPGLNRGNTWKLQTLMYLVWGIFLWFFNHFLTFFKNGARLFCSCFYSSWRKSAIHLHCVAWCCSMSGYKNSLLCSRKC